ncbi:hypothetical protein PAQ31011_03732 [Pandoraea aquatica]|uniref:Uncharacterized protein n=1 Tax=Pandoraea aquatica TaxID=2508290 RepID=A0A5E4X801_9BURK|nr:hypothetical protein PAQ31011_03732 [Pandoraea aquatica]
MMPAAEGRGVVARPKGGSDNAPISGDGGQHEMQNERLLNFLWIFVEFNFVMTSQQRKRRRGTQNEACRGLWAGNARHA